MAATREVFWNIPPAGVAVMYVLTAVAAGVFGYGFYRHLRAWRRGRPAARLRPVGARLAQVARHALAHGRLLADRPAGLIHFAFFWGFVFLFAGTLVVLVHHDLRVRIMQGPFYLYFQSAALDLMGLAATVAVAAAMVQRYVRKVPRLRRGVWSDGFILALFETILVTGFVVEGLRIAATGDPWGPWSFVGYAVARLLGTTGMDYEAMRVAHAALWWFHFVVATVFVAYIPYSKLFHLLLAPANVYLQPLHSPASPEAIDFEKAERLGVSTFADLRWKDLFDLDACTECGRCTAVCPASLTGKPLSPMHLILDLRDEMNRTGGNTRRALSGEVISPPTLWACTTCMACMEACPVFIEHVPKIIDLRRFLVMERSEFPETMQEALRSLEARGHPFRGTTASRTDWYRGLDVVELARAGGTEGVDVVYWAGCAVAFDERNQRVARALVTLLRRAGLSVGVLGAEEQCTGDPARRIGNEFLFEQVARANLETFRRYGITELLVSCPHCLNTLKNEYRAFGGELRVRHHTELLAELLRDGRLRPGPGGSRRVTFHDPCYLGRYNGVFEEPRQVAAASGAAELVEMPRSRRRSLCCGGGGGRSWVEEKGDERVALLRAREALATGADTVGVACPFCMMMLEDGVKAAAGERPVQVRDVAELLEEATREATFRLAPGAPGAAGGAMEGAAAGATGLGGTRAKGPVAAGATDPARESPPPSPPI